MEILKPSLYDHEYKATKVEIRVGKILRRVLLF